MRAVISNLSPWIWRVKLTSGKESETVRGIVTAASELAGWVEREGGGGSGGGGGGGSDVGGGCTIFLNQNEPNVTVTAQHSSEGTAGQEGK